MNVLALCAGVGGLELGIQIAEPGAHGVCYVEREAAAAATLVARMEEGSLAPAPIWSDLGTFDPEPWRGVVDCIASGDPCQPNSVAGRRGGDSDERWLIDQVLRIVEGVRPDRVFRENVAGNADGQLAALVPPLEAMGYRVTAGIFAASEVGTSHRRERLFIMADRAGMQRGEIERAEPNGNDGGVGNAERAEWRAEHGPCGDEGADSVSRRAESPSGLGGADETMADTPRHGRRERQFGKPGQFGDDSPGQHGDELADADRTGFPVAELAREPGAAERGVETGAAASELCGGDIPLFAPGPSDPRWPAILGDAPHLEPSVRRMADGLANRVDRLRAAGNGVVPLAAAYAWRTLEARIRAEDGTTDADMRALA